MRRFDDIEEASDVPPLQRQIEEGVFDAIAKLRRVACGEENFMSDHELRACVALARMTRLVIVKLPEPLRSIAHPDHSPEEVMRLLEIVEGKRTN